MDLKFDQHISNIANKAFRMAGFILRISKEFTSIKCIKLLYGALVRSNIEYCSSIWSPHTKSGIYMLERIQRFFTRSLNYRFNLIHQPYEARLLWLKTSTLENRRLYHDLNVLHYIINTNSQLMNEIIFRECHYPVRNALLFQPPHKRTDVGRFVNPSIRLQHHYNTTHITNTNIEQRSI